MARTTAVLNPANGAPIYVGQGAVAQQGNRKLYTCNTCSREVVWLESKRTGKMYLADVYNGEVARYYISKPHQCRPYAEPASVEPVERAPIDVEYDALTARFLAREITRDEFLADAAIIDAKYGIGV